MCRLPRLTACWPRPACPFQKFSRPSPMMATGSGIRSCRCDFTVSCALCLACGAVSTRTAAKVRKAGHSVLCCPNDPNAAPVVRPPCLKSMRAANVVNPGSIADPVATPRHSLPEVLPEPAAAEPGRVALAPRPALRDLKHECTTFKTPLIWVHAIKELR